MTSRYSNLLEKAIKYHSAGDISRAHGLYSEILIVEPNNLIALVNQGSIFIDLMLFKHAIRNLKMALFISPNDVDALNNYGNALEKLGNTKKALDCFNQALRLDNKNQTVAKNLIVMLLRQSDYNLASEKLDRQIRLNPENIIFKLLKALSLPIIAESNNILNKARNRQKIAIDDLKKIEIQLSDPLTDIGITNFFSAYQNRNDKNHQIQLAKIFRRLYPSLTYSAPHLNKNRVSKKIRIGFVSMYFGNHTITKLNRALIKGLNKNKFDVFMFCPGVNQKNKKYLIDEFSSHIKDIYFPKPTLNETKLIIANKTLDILYYTDIGMEPLTYFLAFSKLASNQCVTFGHPITSGISTIDYFISSELCEPKNAQEHYSEKLVKLPYLSVDYQPTLTEVKKTRFNFKLETDKNIYFCPQSLFKFHPDFDKIMAEILRKDKNGNIILISGQNSKWKDKLVKRFNTKIPDVTSRIHFLPRLSQEEYFAALSKSDVILDTIYFGGGNTSYEAFAMGKIVVTLPGKFLRGRVTLGLYKKMSIIEPIANTTSQFIKLACYYGKNKNARQRLEEMIKDRNSILFNSNEALDAHEKFFQKIC